MFDRIEELLKELRALCKRRPLSPEDRARLREIAVELKELGLTAEDMAEACDYAYTVFSFRNWIKGVPVKDASAKQSAISLMGRVIDEGLTFDKVRLSLTMGDKLEELGVSLEDVSAVVTESSKAKLPYDQLVKLVLKAKSSGLSLQQLAAALSVKDLLESSGLGFENSQILAETLKTCGPVNEVLKAVNAFGALKAIEDAITGAETKRDAIAEKIEQLTIKVSELEGKRASIESELNLHARLVELGFSEEVMKKLLDSSNKFGGPKGVMDAVNVYASLQEISSKLGDTKKKLREVETQLRQTEAEHNHLTPIIAMTESLLYTFKLNKEGIEDILKTARMYGEPLGILQAIGKYGETKNIEKQIKALEGRKIELEARVEVLEKELKKLRGLLDEVKRTAKGILDPFTHNMISNADLLRKKFSETIDAIALKYEEYFQRLSNVIGQAGKLEEELRLARIVSAMIKFPSEAKDVPLDFATLMVEGVSKMCSAKGFNPKIKAGEIFGKKYYFLTASSEMELQDLLDWVKRALLTGLDGGQKRA